MAIKQSTARLIRVLSTLAVAIVTPPDETEEARINPTKPYKPRLRLKQGPIAVMRRRLYQLTKRDPNIQRKKKITRKKYNLKNKQLLERRREFVKEAKKRLPPRPGSTTKNKRGTPAKPSK